MDYRTEGSEEQRTDREVRVRVKEGEREEDALVRRLVELNVNPRRVLEAYPDFVAAKIWTAEDVLSHAQEIPLTDDGAKEILGGAIDSIRTNYIGVLEDCLDREWDAIEEGVRDAYDAYKDKDEEVER